MRQQAVSKSFLLHCPEKVGSPQSARLLLQAQYIFVQSCFPVLRQVRKHQKYEVAVYSFLHFHEDYPVCHKLRLCQINSLYMILICFFQKFCHCFSSVTCCCISVSGIQCRNLFHFIFRQVKIKNIQIFFHSDRV